jgi:YggT family protein
MIGFLVFLVGLIIHLTSLLVIVYVLLTYLLPPYHQVRQVVDRWVEPLLLPIRRIVPPIGMFDFSPLILILLIELLGYVLQRLLLLL